MTEFLADMKTQLLAQVPRLRELRAKKAEDPLAFYEGADGGEGIPDNISVAATETTSGGTFMTRYVLHFSLIAGSHTAVHLHRLSFTLCFSDLCAALTYIFFHLDTQTAPAQSTHPPPAAHLRSAAKKSASAPAARKAPSTKKNIS